MHNMTSSMIMTKRVPLSAGTHYHCFKLFLFINDVGIFRSNCLFIGENLREAVNDGRADFMPVFLSEIPHLFRRNILNIDVALVHVSPPDEHGFCSLGPSVDIARSAIQNAKYIIGKNKNVFGSLRLHGLGKYDTAEVENLCTAAIIVQETITFFNLTPKKQQKKHLQLDIS